MNYATIFIVTVLTAVITVFGCLIYYENNINVQNPICSCHESSFQIGQSNSNFCTNISTGEKYYLKCNYNNFMEE